jgi:hypothetical protein
MSDAFRKVSMVAKYVRERWKESSNIRRSNRF